MKVQYREDVILPLVADKKVLDCGGVDHNFGADKRQEGDWLHDLLVEAASECLGVDILEDRVKEINANSKYSFIACNVEELRFRQEYDVVVAGEIIEHIYNAGLFLDGVWRSLKNDGILVITTPNAYGASYAFQSWFRGREVYHKEHTCYYSRQTLSYIVERHGFQVESIQILQRPAKTPIRKFVRKIQHIIRPNNSEQLVLVAKKMPDQKKYIDKW